MAASAATQGRPTRRRLSRLSRASLAVEAGQVALRRTSSCQRQTPGLHRAARSEGGEDRELGEDDRIRGLPEAKRIVASSRPAIIPDGRTPWELKLQQQQQQLSIEISYRIEVLGFRSVEVMLLNAVMCGAKLIRQIDQ